MAPSFNRSISLAWVGLAALASVATSIPLHWYEQSDRRSVNLDPGERRGFHVTVEVRAGALPDYDLGGVDVAGLFVEPATVSFDGEAVDFVYGRAVAPFDPLADCVSTAACRTSFDFEVHNASDTHHSGPVSVHVWMDSDDRKAPVPAADSVRVTLEEWTLDDRLGREPHRTGLDGASAR